MEPSGIVIGRREKLLSTLPLTSADYPLGSWAKEGYGDI